MVQVSVKRPEMRPMSARDVLRRTPLALTVLAIAIALIYILFVTKALPDTGVGGYWRTTTNGSAISDPTDFFYTVLDSVTFAGLLFIVASGFTLIFGLMRTVNMAHGSFFLLGGYIAYDVQQSVTTSSGFGLTSAQVSWWQWIVPAIVASGAVAVIGLVMQQGFLRWNQGQEIRQALITIAVSLILADQMIAHWGGLAKNIAFPNDVGTGTSFIKLGGLTYGWSRMFILLVAIGIGIGLWLWLHKTRIGMVIRAGVDDRHMVSALGVNVQLVFALSFLVGSALAGFGGVMGGSFAGLAPEVDGQWLLNALVVVIIGGMGSLGGAAVGALLFAFVSNFSGLYLPTTSNQCCTQYSVIFTFALLAFVLALRPLGLFGRPA
jgi:branched-chain amino acid transport system permease protein